MPNSPHVRACGDRKQRTSYASWRPCSQRARTSTVPFCYLHETAPNTRVRTMTAGLRDVVRDGSPLAAALGRYPRAFSRLHVAMVSAGEASGQLAPTLARLADLLERQQRLAAVGHVGVDLSMPSDRRGRRLHCAAADRSAAAVRAVVRAEWREVTRLDTTTDRNRRLRYAVWRVHVARLGRHGAGRARRVPIAARFVWQWIDFCCVCRLWAGCCARCWLRASRACWALFW